MGELFPVTDLSQMDIQTVVYAPARAGALQRIRPAIENWETSFMKYNQVGGFIDDKSKTNILHKIIPNVEVDTLTRTL